MLSSTHHTASILLPSDSCQLFCRRNLSQPSGDLILQACSVGKGIAISSYFEQQKSRERPRLFSWTLSASKLAASYGSHTQDIIISHFFGTPTHSRTSTGHPHGAKRLRRSLASGLNFIIMFLNLHLTKLGHISYNRFSSCFNIISFARITSSVGKCCSCAFMHTATGWCIFILGSNICKKPELLTW